MSTHRAPDSRFVRIALRTATVSACIAALSLTGTAYADTPSTWADAPHHGAFDYLLVLLIIPAGIAIVVTVLTILPSLIRGESHEKGDAWRTEEEWFGGPRQGIQASDRPDSKTDKGGASGNW